MILPILFLLVPGAPPAAQQGVAMGPCKQWVTGVGWAPCTGGGDGRSGDGGAAAAAAAAEAARKEVQAAKAAADQGAAAYARGDFKAAAIAYLAATRHQPGNAEYRKQRAMALLALSKQNGTMLLDDVSGTGGADGFDGSRIDPGAGFALPTVKTPTFSDTLFTVFEIPVDLSDPKNANIKTVMARVEQKLKSNLDALRSDGAIEPDVKGLESTIAELNKALEPVVPKGTQPLTVEKAETLYNHYQIKVKK